MSRAAVVAEARAWIGTAYVHGAARRGGGTDCLGLVRGVWRALVGREPEAVPPYTVDWDEAAGDEVLAAAAGRWLRPAEGDGPLPGQVLLFRMRAGGVAKHLGIVARVGDAPTFVHAYSGRGVLETSLSEPWRRRVVARHDFPLEF